MIADHPEPNFEFLFDYRVKLAPSYDLGKTPSGRRTTGGILGGTFEGPRLRGVVEPTGGDYAIRRPDNVLEADVRTVLKTDDEKLIYMHYIGLLHPWSEIVRAFTNPQEEAPELYWRMVHRFETSAEEYLWTNKILAIGIGRPEGVGAAYRVYEIL